MDTYLAVDLGASSGRVMAGWRSGNGGRIELSEVRRFQNIPVERDGHLCWDIDGLITEIFAGLRDGMAQARAAGRPVVSIGVDSWAVDFGLLDDAGELVGPVVHYRDSRTTGMMERVFEQVSQREIFTRTGIQFLPFNTIYQLAALKEQDPAQLARARHFLMIADLVALRLTGRMTCEYTNATTTQLYDVREGRWSRELLEGLDLPEEIFPAVVQPGSLIGPLRDELMREWDAEGVKVIAVATHDTASAVAAVPARPGEQFAYLSCGTWSLLGTELRSPNLTEEALAANFTNEGGADGTVRFLKNIMGLWILQECRRHWLQENDAPESRVGTAPESRRSDLPESANTPARENPDLSWQSLERQAREADAHWQATGRVLPVIDVDDARLLPPGDMPARVRECAAELGAVIEEADHGTVVACVLRSLAQRYAEVLRTAEDLTGQRFERLYVVGGGVQNVLLREWTAQAIGREVVAGPAEATALGNIGLQMIAAGELRDLAELRGAV